MKKIIFSLLLLSLIPSASWGMSYCSPDYTGKTLGQIPQYGKHLCYNGYIVAEKGYWKVDKMYDELEWYCGPQESCKAQLKHHYNRCNTAHTDRDYAWPKTYDLPSIENWCRPGYIPYGPFYDPYMMKFYWKCTTDNRNDTGENCYFNGYKGAWVEADIAECGDGANSKISLEKSPVFTDLCKKGTPSGLKKGLKDVSWTCNGKHRSVSCTKRVYDTSLYGEEDDGQVKDGSLECGLVNPVISEMNYSPSLGSYTKSFTYFNNPPRKELLCSKGTYGEDLNIYTISNKETGNGNYYAWTCRSDDGRVRYCKVSSVCSTVPNYNDNIYTYGNSGFWEVNPYKTRTSSDNNTWREMEGSMKTYCWGQINGKGTYAAKCGPINQRYIKDFGVQMLCEMGKPINIFRQTKNGVEQYSWQCEGEKDGEPTIDDGTILFANCNAYYKSSSYDGVCGKANYIEIDPNNIDEDSLCYQGKPINKKKDTNLYRWTCEGVNGGKPMDCRAEYIPDLAIFTKVDGVCGEAFSSQDPLNKYCASGTAILISGDTSRKWICKGLYGGTNSDCPSNKGRINDECGSANGKYFDDIPKDGLCKAGSASVISGTGPWSWECEGSGGGSKAKCSASKMVGTCNWVCSDWSDCLNGKQSRTCKLQPSECYTSNNPELTRGCGSSGLSCGDSHGKVFNVAPKTSLCNDGISLGVVDGTKWWYWICKDKGSDSAILCSAKKDILVNGECGPSNGRKMVSAPIDGLCNKGTPSQVFGNGPWVWLCNPLGGGSLKVCYALKESLSVNGKCGQSNGGFFEEAPQVDLCILGSATTITSSDNWQWSCQGINGGIGDSCSANKKSRNCTWTCGDWGNCSNGVQSRTCSSYPLGCLGNNPYPTSKTCNAMINGQCGSANGGTYSSAPTSGLCNSGSASSVSLSGSTWRWTCSGSNGGSTASCYANKTVTPSPINGQCGSANGGTYSSAPTSGLCNSGSASIISGSGPWTWSCVGENGGTTANCSTVIKSTINIMAYIQSGVSGVTEATYRSFVDDINKLYSKNGIDAGFAIGNIKWYEKGSNCGSSFEGNDVIMCVGPGKGGYMGAPYYTVGVNTDSPYGFGDVGVMAEVHELAHYLGFQDLYWLKTTPTSSPLPTSIEKDIMTSPYDMSNTFGVNAKYILQMNVSKVKTGGKESIVYPKSRTPSNFSINIGIPNQMCSIYARERDYSLFKSRILSNPVSKTANASGVFEMGIVAGDPSDNNFDIYQIICGNNTYWISSLLQEDCYRQKGANQVCNVKCQGNNGWCVSE